MSDISCKGHMSGIFQMLFGWLPSHAGQTRCSGFVVKDCKALLSSLHWGTVRVENFLVKFSTVSWSQIAVSKDQSFFVFFLMLTLLYIQFQAFQCFSCFFVSLMAIYIERKKKEGKRYQWKQICCSCILRMKSEWSKYSLSSWRPLSAKTQTPPFNQKVCRIS